MRQELDKQEDPVCKMLAPGLLEIRLLLVEEGEEEGVSLEQRRGMSRV